jgi:hypothetical protein
VRRAFEFTIVALAVAADINLQMSMQGPIDRLNLSFAVALVLTAAAAAIVLRHLRSGTTIGNDVEPRRLRIVASGPELATGYCRALIGLTLYLLPSPWISIRPGGIVISPPFGRAHALPKSEIRAVVPIPGVPEGWVKVEHDGIDSRSPLVLMAGPGSSIRMALDSFAEHPSASKAD